RDMDLKEKQNKGFFARGNEISRIIVDGIRSGEISKIYENDSLSDKSVKTKDQFFQSFEMRKAVDYDPWDATKSYIATDRVKYLGKDYEATADNSGLAAPNDPSVKDYWQVTNAGQALTFQPADIYKLQVVEDIIFDKRRSRLYYDVIAIQMMAWDENGGAFKPLGWIKYSDLEKLWRAHPEKAIWFNRQNTAQNRNFADAFLLRLFHASIYKVENPDDLDLSSIYTNYNESVFAREWEEMKLMEKEHNLWEY
ncbi:MAG: gliding motility protein GldN, partial [Proteobacteria bacterium]|nr:gliding motility protein GldN [Pseudomonadota bacterium]